MGRRERGEREGQYSEDLERNPMQNVAEGPKVESGSGEALSVLSIVIAQPEEVLDVKGTVSKSASPEKVVAAVALAKKGFLTRSDSEHEQCR